MIKKKAFIIPGFREDATVEGYKEIATAFQNKGCDASIVDITWNRRVMSDYVREFRKITKDVGNECYLLGFSFGAVVAFLAAADLKPKALFLCSPSPYFAEDLDKTPSAWKKFIGKRRVVDFSTYSFREIAKHTLCQTFIFLGEEEAKKYPSLKKRSEDAAKTLHNGTLIRIPKAHHKIGQPEYQEAVKAMIQKIV